MTVSFSVNEIFKIRLDWIMNVETLAVMRLYMMGWKRFFALTGMGRCVQSRVRSLLLIQDTYIYIQFRQL